MGQTAGRGQQSKLRKLRYACKHIVCRELLIYGYILNKYRSQSSSAKVRDPARRGRGGGITKHDYV